MKNVFIKEKLIKTFGLGKNKITEFSKGIGLNARKNPKYVKKKHLSTLKMHCKNLTLDYELRTIINKHKDILERIQTHKYSKLKKKKNEKKDTGNKKKITKRKKI